jgi:hypothetical protein
MVFTPPDGGQVTRVQRRPRCHFNVLPADDLQLSKSRVFSVSLLETVIWQPTLGLLEESAAAAKVRFDAPIQGEGLGADTPASQTRIRA